MKPKILLSIISLTALTAIVVGAVTIAPRVHIPLSSIQEHVAIEPGFYKVSYVSDGDTFTVKMDGTEEKVRLIGVDTPETVKPNSPSECYGKAASDFTKYNLTNQTVRLEADPVNQNRDRYNRLLRYAYLQDGSLFNATLIKEGYAFAYLSFPFTKADEFRQLQTDARKKGVGIWSGDCVITDQNGRFKTNQL